VDVRPEEGSGASYLGGVEERRRVAHRHIVGVEVEHVAEAAVEQREGLGGPPGEQAGSGGERVGAAHLPDRVVASSPSADVAASIDALCSALEAGR
jgi:hypothetical protein